MSKEETTRKATIQRGRATVENYYPNIGIRYVAAQVRGCKRPGPHRSGDRRDSAKGKTGKVEVCRDKVE